MAIIGSGDCASDKYKILQYKTMYDFAMGMAKRLWKAQEGGWASALAYNDTMLRSCYDAWMRCVAQSGDYVTWQVVSGGGHGNMPTCDEWLKAVHNGWNTPEMERIKSW